MFTTEQIEALEKPLDSDRVKQRDKGKATLSYIEGWDAIATANRIFGYGRWSRETVELSHLCSTTKKAKHGDRDNHYVSYRALVRVSIRCNGDSFVQRDGVGFGQGIASDEGEAHEGAIKEAETDAMKRALSTFGNQFGLALYDKEQRNVVNGRDEERKLELIEHIEEMGKALKGDAYYDYRDQTLIEVDKRRRNGKPIRSLPDCPLDVLEQWAASLREKSKATVGAMQ